MLKKILAIVTLLYSAMAFAAVDINKATAADLDGIKGIGPSMSTRILDARKKGDFKDWEDLIERVRGVGQGNAAKFSDAGLTVGGAAFKPAAAAAKESKKAAKAETKAAKEVKEASADSTKAPVATAAATVKK